MATIRLPRDFKEFLQQLRSSRVEYLLVGGYAVAYYGYPRATGDLDTWVAVHPRNAGALVEALKAFGFDLPDVTESLFGRPDRVIRMGVPPVRIEILTGIDGVEFADCYGRRETVNIDGVDVDIINLADLKANKRAAGRFQDLDDVENLP